MKQQNEELYVERQQILEELERVTQQKYEAEADFSKVRCDNEELQLILKERQELSGKYHALEIKMQADIEYYERYEWCESVAR